MEKSPKLITAAGVLALGLLALGLCVSSGLKSLSDNQRVVNVKGLAEMEVKANKVTWPITMKIVGNDLADIYEQVSRNNEAVRQFLTSQGIKAEEISDNAPAIQDKAAEVYGEQNFTYRYSVTNVVTVSTDKVDLVRRLMARQGELLKKGVVLSASSYENPVVYEYTGLNDVKPKMIEEATRNARTAAEKFAKDSESRLGKIKTASQGQFSIEDRDQNTPQIKRVRVVSSVTYFLK